jgi:hypothetical protein
MDVSMFLALAVAFLTVLCAYLLFNDVPRPGGLGARRRR